MLIIPEGARREFDSVRRRKVHTGVFVTCPRCGYTWERTVLFSRYARCPECRKHITVDPVMEVRA
ncbi:hypothetical protein GCM10007108_08670 [Thermogymnomonas acidicola]|uniref:Uncharacterized protein n=1 Tax=Thermogymnomonas acidicola TaxID=399579 RepID=A0AA37F9Y9_9ARCH|nr:hypothetical protein [Thermogymnomonas acidicola]GGM72829.1 hypothetical protein GCM10007108_08670 [Thermogymnomonas acidicola]